MSPLLRLKNLRSAYCGKEELKDPLRSRCPADNCLKVILVSIPKVTVSGQKVRYISAKSDTASRRLGRGA